MFSHYQGNLLISLERIHNAEAVSTVLTFSSSIFVLVDFKMAFWLEEKADYFGYRNK